MFRSLITNPVHSCHSYQTFETFQLNHIQFSSLKVSRMDSSSIMDEYRVGRVRGRLRLGWMDGVKVALANRGMMVEAARQCAKYRKE